MAKGPRKSVSIKDLPLPKGFTIVGGGKQKEAREDIKEARPKTARLPK